MPYKNIYFKKENFLLNIFYGVLSSNDLRYHTLEMYKQRTLTDSFSKITDATLLSGVENVTSANISSTISLKLSEEAIKSDGSIIVSNTPEINELAKLVQSEGNRIGDNIQIASSLSEALEHYGLLDLEDKATSHIEKLREYFPMVK